MNNYIALIASSFSYKGKALVKHHCDSEIKVRLGCFFTLFSKIYNSLKVTVEEQLFLETSSRESKISKDFHIF